MNDIIFAREFSFYQIRISRFAHTDNRGVAHPHYIAYMREGTGRLVGSDRTIEVAPGDFFYIPEGYPYQSFWRGKDAACWESFGFRYFPRSEGESYPLQKIGTSEESLGLLEKLTADRRVTCTSIGLFYQLLGSLMPRMSVAPESRKFEIVNRAEEYMYHSTGFTAAEVARHCGVSESGLYAAFREVRGATPTQAKHRLQAERAVQLLTTTDLTIEEISGQLGFSSSIYFRKIISEQTGMTPRAIRKGRRI